MLIIQIIFFSAAALLVYTGLIYPCLGLLIGRARRKPSDSDAWPGVSILVPAHNEAAVIVAKLANLRTLDYPPGSIELIIADDGSVDGTADLVRQHMSERCRLLTISQRSGKANALNQLVLAAQYPLLLFTDANVMLQPDAVKELVGNLTDPKVGAVTGEVRLFGSDEEFASGESFYYQLERRIQYAESRLGSVMGVDGGMFLLRKELYQPIPTDTILDDFLISMIVMRAGRRIVYDGNARALESGTPTSRQEFARRVRITAGAVQLLKRGQIPRLHQPLLWFQFFSHKLLRWFAPALLTILLISNLLLVTSGWLYQLFFGCQMFGYMAFLMTYFVPKLRTSKLGGILFYVGLSQLATVVGMRKGLFNRQPPQWEKGSRVEELTS
jgi:poly-beta-1,6-N-acetyl-D-glucosamine synthase